MRTVRINTPAGIFEGFEGDHITEHLVRLHGYQRSDLAMLRDFVRKGDVILDVGAHIGTFSVPLAQAAGPDGRVTAFEPMPDHVGLLRRNIEANDLGRAIDVVQAVVARPDADLFVQRVEGNSGATSFSHDSGEPVDVDVDVVALDDWWRSHGRPEVNVVKIDIEGMEFDALSCSREMVATTRPLVEFEVDLLRRPPLAELDGFFRDLGYDFFVNAAARDAADDAFSLAHLRSARRLAPAYPRIFDVVAVDRASNRYPERAASAWATDFRVMRLAARSLAGRLLRRVRRRTARG